MLILFAFCLEKYWELRIAVSKTLTSLVIYTTLNFPPGDEVVTIPAHQVEAQVDYPPDPTHGSSSFDSTTIPAFLVQQPSTSLTNPKCNSSSPSSKLPAKSPTRNRSAKRKQDELKYGYEYLGRTPSKYPNRQPADKPRGRSRDKNSARSRERSSSFSNEVDTLQYHNIYSKSPSRTIPEMFRCPLTPGTMKK